MAALSVTGRVLQTLVRLCCARPLLTIALAATAAAIGAGYAAHALTLETSKFHLLPRHQPYATLYKSYAEDFGQLEDIVVVVQSPEVDTSTAYAVRLAAALRHRMPGTDGDAVHQQLAEALDDRFTTRPGPVERFDLVWLHGLVEEQAFSWSK